MENLTGSIKRNLTLANFLSSIRLALIVVFVVLFKKEHYIGAFVTLVFSAISDLLDGIAARALNQVTELGKILDPIADKLTLIAVLICICTMFPIVAYFAVVLIIKDLLMLIGGGVLLKKKIAPPAAKWYGKLGTTIFYSSVLIIVVLKVFYQHVASDMLIITLFSLTTAVMLFAVIRYFMTFRLLLKENNQKIINKKKPKGE